MGLMRKRREFCKYSGLVRDLFFMSLGGFGGKV